MQQRNKSNAIYGAFLIFALVSTHSIIALFH